MHSVSFFMKEVKQRFSQWYNLRNDRRGTLWEERYKSVLVENSCDALILKPPQNQSLYATHFAR